MFNARARRIPRVLWLQDILPDRQTPVYNPVTQPAKAIHLTGRPNYKDTVTPATGS